MICNATLNIFVCITLLFTSHSFVLPTLKLNLIKKNERALKDLNVLTDFPISSTIAGSVCLFGLTKLIIYWRMQFVIADIVGGIPPSSKVVELDAQDGKQIFYLSTGCDYTAVMGPGSMSDESKRQQRLAYNERIVLESIGKANGS